MKETMADRESFSVEAMSTSPTRIYGPPFTAKSCHAKVKMATGSMLSLWPL